MNSVKKILWRLTIIFLIPTLILDVLVIRPIRWVFTGSLRGNNEQVLKSITYRWMNKLNMFD